MSKINLLSSKIYNRIAAGEVVERPASVVKELVENSIDAGAKRITVEISGGGIAGITVTDDGCGIEKSEISKALLPHATSKISSLSDLDAISTLGFRGEALPSIASVSKISVKSRTVAQDIGYEITSEGGNTGEVSPCGASVGTTVNVKNLFFNTPAREKFLKSERAEESEITSLMAKFILGNPELGFKYVSDGETVYSSYGDGEESAFISVYGAKTLNDCFKIDSERNGVKISGYIGKHYFTKGNRTHMTVFINGRFIVNQTIIAAVQNAYSHYLMKRQYPFCVLKISVPPSEVDVNVHPSKTDVRFSNNQIIYGAVYSVISKVLDGSSEALSIVAKDDAETQESQPTTQTKPKPEISEKEYDYIVRKNPAFSKIVFKDSGAPSLSETDVNIATAENEVKDIFAENKAYIENLEKEKAKRASEPEQKTILERELKYVGQALNTFLIFEDGEDLYIIDQHAAHERLLFDKFNAELKKESVSVQPLIVPAVITLSGSEFSYLDSKKEELRSLGFDIEEFGRSTVKISCVPVFLTGLNVEKFFTDLLSDLDELKTLSANSLLKDEIAKRACKAAVKSGDKLSDEEVKTLMEMIRGDLGLKCPHGRPIAVRITRNEIDKWFKRIV